MLSRRRYERFDPITVRAATRVVRMGRGGRLTGAEIRYYLGELAAMEGRRDAAARRALGRLARRRACLGRAGVRPGGTRPPTRRRTHRWSLPTSLSELGCP